MLETVIYKLVTIDGDYAVLLSEDGIENRGRACASAAGGGRRESNKMGEFFV